MVDCGRIPKFIVALGVNRSYHDKRRWQRSRCSDAT
jgi:hypothetical protein